MNGLKNHKKSNPKNWKKTVKVSEIAACEQKTTRENVKNCSNNVFSFYFKIEAKLFQAAKALAFLLHFLFRRDQ